MCGIDFFFKFLFGFGSVLEKKLGFGSECIWFGSVCKNSVRFG